MAAEGREIDGCKKFRAHLPDAFECAVTSFSSMVFRFSLKHFDKGHLAMEPRVNDVMAGRSDSVSQKIFLALVTTLI